MPSEKASIKVSADYINELVHDQKWQDHAIRIIELYWANQNGKKRKALSTPVAQAA